MQAPFARVLVILGAASLMTGVQAAPPAKDNFSPLKATFSISEQVSPGGPCTQLSPYALTGAVSGTGVASHIGKVSFTATDCIIPIDSTQTNFLFVANDLVLTTPNGDTITGSYQGTFTVQGMIGTFSGSFALSGGTGRFANASGFGNLAGTEMLDLAGGGPAKGQITLEGGFNR